MLVDICAMIALGFAVLVGCLGFVRRRSIAENWKKRLIRKVKKHGSYIEAVAVKNEERANGTYFTVVVAGLLLPVLFFLPLVGVYFCQSYWAWIWKC